MGIKARVIVFELTMLKVSVPNTDWFGWLELELKLEYLSVPSLEQTNVPLHLSRKSHTAMTSKPFSVSKAHA